MKAYRIKHIPTGLYYKPSNGMSNLSEKGKVYLTNSCGLLKNGAGLHCTVKKESSIIKRYGEQLSKNKSKRYAVWTSAAVQKGQEIQRSYQLQDIFW